MVQEDVVLLDGSTKTIEIKPLGALTADIIIDKYLKINSIKQTPEGSEIDMTGSHITLIRGDFLRKGIKDVDPDTIDPEDVDRIYKKYYEKHLNLALRGMGGNPN